MDGGMGSEKAERGSTFSTSAADYYVPSLPGLPDLASHPTRPLNVWAGTVPSYPGEHVAGAEGPTGVDAEIFFLMVKNRRAAGKGRVVFWFNGGPGCSSFDGAMMEVGPFRTVPASKSASGVVELELVDGGWEEFGTMVFIDQPPGTGLSIVPTNGYLHELDQASAHMIKFLQNFYTIFPELQTVSTYLAGESFAGQYIPYIADAILKSNMEPPVSLVGIAIGNGWMDPREQYQGYVDFAYEKGLIKQESEEAEVVEKAMAQCQSEVDKYANKTEIPINLAFCDGVMGSVTAPFTTDLNGKKICMNVYDVRLTDDWPACGMNWPPDLPDLYEYLRRSEVTRALHASKKEFAWVECNNQVSTSLELRRSPASIGLIPGIIEKGVKVMMFAGDEDLICNYKGIERTIARLDWGGEQGMGDTAVDEWYVNNTYAGTWQTARGLTYVRVTGGSHMVGFDLPHVTNDMIMRFMEVDPADVLGSVALPSRLGNDERVRFGGPLEKSNAESGSYRTALQTDTWYQAASGMTLLIFLVGAAALFFYLRARTRRRSKIGLNLRAPRDAEERVPLGRETHELEDYQDAGRREESSRSPVFEIGDDEFDDADGADHKRRD